MGPWTRVVVSTTLTLLALLTSVPVPAQQPQIRSNVELVLVPVSARGKNGRIIADLSAADFTIKEGGKKQTITSFSVDPVPISAAILIDTGISEVALNRVKASFPALMGAFAEDDEIAVYRFDKFVEKVTDFTADRIRIERAFASLASATPTVTSMAGGPFSNAGPVLNGVPVTPGVDSANRTIAQPTKVLHDAIFVAAEDLSSRPVERRRVLFVASDGRNQSSEHSFDTALERLLLNEVQFFGFGVDTSVFQRVRSPLTSYSRATGGETCFTESQSSLEACYPVSTEDARNQYVLGYTSTNKRPERKPVFREIQVQVARNGLEVRHRKGYYQAP